MSAVLGGDMPAPVAGISGHTCNTCPFWRFGAEGEKGQRVGICRESPPTVFMAVGQGVGGARPVAVTMFPETAGDGSCGKHPEVAKARAYALASAAKAGMDHPISYDRKEGDLSRKPTAAEMERMAEVARQDAGVPKIEVQK